jgi:hypothetical protein
MRASCDLARHWPRRFAGIAVALALIAATAGFSPRAESRPVDLQLVLAVDASGSVDATRFELQRRGYADAFASPRILKAIRSGPLQAIAVTMVQWTGPSLQVQVVGWSVIEDEASAVAFARNIGATPRRLYRGGTSISGALDYASRLFAGSGFDSERRVIDISGDGANNSGRPADAARDDAVRAGIVINGLPILALEPELDLFYRDNVIGGAGSFVRPVDSFDHFGDAILDKLITEIAGPQKPGRVLQARQETPEAGESDQRPQLAGCASWRSLDRSRDARGRIIACPSISSPP